MTSYAAYDAGLPCKNTSCKSRGSAHPNCQCYGDMSEGGEAVPFCSQTRDHNPGCKYLADGGAVTIPTDRNHALAGHIAHSGIVGMLKLDKNHDLEKYYKSIDRGHKKLEHHIDNLFENKKPEPAEDRTKHRQFVDDWISHGGISKAIEQEIYKHNAPAKMFAEGGMAEPHKKGVLHDHPLEMAHPDQNILLQETKGRVSNYLSSLKPQENMPKLAFDSDADHTAQNKNYHKALKIADHPLSVLHHVGDGTLDQEHVGHLTAMYPEVADALHKKVTEKIIKSELEGKKPNSKIRLGLSTLMGTPLSGEMTPQNISAAQSVFAQKSGSPQVQGAGAAPKKGSPSALSKSDEAFLTRDQALAARQQRKS